MSRYSESVRIAVNEVLPNIYKGCYWAFSDKTTLGIYAEELKNTEGIQYRELDTENVLIVVDTDIIINCLLEIHPKGFTSEDAQKVNTTRGINNYVFESFLVKKGLQKEQFEGIIGIYCTHENEISKLSYNGKQYDSFRLHLYDVLRLLAAYGYLINICGTFVEPYQAVNNFENLWRSCKINDSKKGMLIKIKCNVDKDTMLEYEKAYKQKYDI